MAASNPEEPILTQAELQRLERQVEAEMALDRSVEHLQGAGYEKQGESVLVMAPGRGGEGYVVDVWQKLRSVVLVDQVTGTILATMTDWQPTPTRPEPKG